MTECTFSLGKAPIGKCFIIHDNYIDLVICYSDNNNLIKTIAYECDSKRSYIDNLLRDNMINLALNGHLRVL